MNPSRRQLLLWLGTVWSAGAGAQPGLARVVGILGSARDEAPSQQLVAAMEKLGWNEGRNVRYDCRSGGDDYERLGSIARGLVAAKADVIVVTAGVTAALAARDATGTTPIFALGVADPVRFGLVRSLARPDGNVTGFMATTPAWGKYLELAHEALPRATRVALLANPTNVVFADYVAQNEVAAKALGLQLRVIEVADERQLDAAFVDLARERAEVLVVGPDRVFIRHMGKLLKRAQEQQLPVVGPNRPSAYSGALLAYGLDAREIYERSAGAVDRILRGAKPADIPFERPTRYQLVLNLGAARRLGIAVPASLRVRADEVLE
ncbi:MAG TPA: ABC transporter substrate-binding protein [Burkholderiaceae bacterium]|nr:ABC transporter substrate-binding protein [Burkholderiaceae bacterium]